MTRRWTFQSVSLTITNISNMPVLAKIVRFSLSICAHLLKVIWLQAQTGTTCIAAQHILCSLVSRDFFAFSPCSHFKNYPVPSFPDNPWETLACRKFWAKHDVQQRSRVRLFTLYNNNMRHLKVLKYLAEGAGSAPFFGHEQIIFCYISTVEKFVRVLPAFWGWDFFWGFCSKVEDMGIRVYVRSILRADNRHNPGILWEII